MPFTAYIQVLEALVCRTDITERKKALRIIEGLMACHRTATIHKKCAENLLSSPGRQKQGTTLIMDVLTPLNHRNLTDMPTERCGLRTLKDDNIPFVSRRANAKVPSHYRS
jgi:hypothetical protein